jgi:hypothetical protein
LGRFFHDWRDGWLCIIRPFFFRSHFHFAASPHISVGAHATATAAASMVSTIHELAEFICRKSACTSRRRGAVVNEVWGGIVGGGGGESSSV